MAMSKSACITETDRHTSACCNPFPSPHAPVVFVVDGETSVRHSLEMMTRRAGWEPRTFACAEEFLARPPTMTPSCLIAELTLSGLSGLDLQQLILNRAALPIIFVSKYADVRTTVQAMKAGAFEFLTKPVEERVLVNTIRWALERSELVLREHFRMRALVQRYELLSRREHEVITLVVSGRSNKQVGGELGISEVTVKAHRGSIMRKMQARSFAELLTMVRSIHAMSRRDMPQSTNGRRLCPLRL